jgi:hypothetical protein
MNLIELGRAYLDIRNFNDGFIYLSKALMWLEMHKEEEETEEEF